MLRVLRSAFVMASIAAAATAAAAGEQLGGEQLVFGRPGESVDIKTFDKPALSDLLTIDPSISMFYDYVRQSETLVKRLTANTPTTIFAPRDAAILSLNRKPHEGPIASSVDIGMSTEEEQDREMLAYLEMWTSSYFVDGADVQLKDGNQVPSLAGEHRKLGFTEGAPGGDMDWQKVVVQPGEAKIVAAREARDGMLYVIDRVLQ